MSELEKSQENHYFDFFKMKAFLNRPTKTQKIMFSVLVAQVAIVACMPFYLILNDKSQETIAPSISITNNITQNNMKNEIHRQAFILLAQNKQVTAYDKINVNFKTEEDNKVCTIKIDKEEGNYNAIGQGNEWQKACDNALSSLSGLVTSMKN